MGRWGDGAMGHWARTHTSVSLSHFWGLSAMRMSPMRCLNVRAQYDCCYIIWMDARTSSPHNPVKDSEIIPIPTKSNPYDLTVKRDRGCLAVHPPADNCSPYTWGWPQALLFPLSRVPIALSMIVHLKRNYRVLQSITLPDGYCSRSALWGRALPCASASPAPLR
jgi:hypothetical protein